METNSRFAMVLADMKRDEEEENLEENVEDATDPPCLLLDQMPTDVLLTIFGFLERQELGCLAQVCSRFRNLAYSDCLWLGEAREALGSNQTDSRARGRSQEQLGARERVRLGRCWTEGDAREGLVAVQSAKYMPRLQLEAKRLWVSQGSLVLQCKMLYHQVSWGSKIWCHPRLPGGGVSKTTSRVLRGHSDDVSKFVVEEGMVVSGGRYRCDAISSHAMSQF